MRIVAWIVAGAAILSACQAPAPLGRAVRPPVDQSVALAPLRLPQMPLHDPWIVADRASKTYYLYNSNHPRMTGVNGVGAMVYTSRDLVNWTWPRVVFTVPRGIWADAGGWAPEVHAYRNRYWLLITLHNQSAALPPSRPGWSSYRRGTVLAVSDRLEGPFELVRGGEPVAPARLMTLDGTLYVDRTGKPWFVYAHEWLQGMVGTMEVLPLTNELAADGAPLLLFRATDATWSVGLAHPARTGFGYVTDGPELFRTRAGALLMLWSTWATDGYAQLLARSRSGQIAGPWDHLAPLMLRDSGHGMLFETFDGVLMMVLHRPFFGDARGKFYEMRDAGDRVEIVRHRTDLDGDPPGTP